MKKRNDNLKKKGTGMSFFLMDTNIDLNVKRLETIPFPKKGVRVFSSSNYYLKG